MIRITSVAAVLLAAVAMPAARGQTDLKSGTLFSSGNTFEEQDGAALYHGICQGCHQPDAKGAIGAAAYPALAENPKLVTPLYPAVIVLKGLRSMPAFGDSLSDEQIAQVVNYVRSHFGNHYTDTITAETVKGLHPEAP